MAKYRVKHIDTSRQRLLLALGLGIALLVVVLSFWLGGHRANTDQGTLEGRVKKLNQQLNTLNREKQELVEEKALLQRTNELDKTAMQSAKEALSELQGEMVELKKELTFYQSLLSPEDRKPGLNITSLHLEAVGEGVYHYSLVLSQVRQNDRQTKGTVSLGVAKVVPDDVEQETVDWAVTKVLDQQSFAFKYFQRIEGELSLPAELDSTSLLVRVSPAGNRLKPVSQSYNWNSLIRGSN